MCRFQYLRRVDSALAAGGLQSRGSAAVAHGLSCSLACGIFPDQGWNLCPLPWQKDSLPLGHQGSSARCFFLFFFFAQWTTHARKGLPALLALKTLSEFLECLCEPCTQYSVLYSVLCHLIDVKLAVGWELAGRMGHCISRAFSADI